MAIYMDGNLEHIQIFQKYTLKNRTKINKYKEAHNPMKY